MIGGAKQCGLLGGLGGKTRGDVGGRGKIEQTLGGADGIRAAAGDLAGDRLRRRQWIIDHARREAIGEGFAGREHAAGIGQLAHDILACKVAHQ